MAGEGKRGDNKEAGNYRGLHIRPSLMRECRSILLTAPPHHSLTVADTIRLEYTEVENSVAGSVVAELMFKKV
jgi:hypothetical protein